MSKTAPVIGIALYGGLGSRFGSDLPKQFLDCGGKPLLFYVLEAFEESPEVDETLVVSHPNYLEKTKALIQEGGFQKVKAVIPGGFERSDSVRNALNFLKRKSTPGETIILIQDGDRPGLDEDLIKRNVEAVLEEGAAITALPSKDTCFISEDGTWMSGRLDRKRTYRAQTPQSFRFRLIEKAYQQAEANPNASFTDDASLVLLLNVRPKIVLGSEDNLKITEKEDLDLFLQRRKQHAS